MLTDSSGPGELSVQRGQQVEVVAPAANSAALVMVRVANGGPEGLVPISCLKQPAGGFKFKANGIEGKAAAKFLATFIMTFIPCTLIAVVVAAAGPAFQNC